MIMLVPFYAIVSASCDSAQSDVAPSVPPVESPINEQTFTISPAAGTSAIPSDVSSLFNASEDAQRAPKLIYPNDGVLMPPNLGRVEIHWLKGSETNTLYEISFVNARNKIIIYTRCQRPSGVQADGCIAELSPEIWSGLSKNKGGGEPFDLQVRGTDDAGSAVGVSSKQKLELASSEIKGVLYYWTTTKKTSIRFDFGSPNPVPDQPLDPLTAIQAVNSENKCFGCHALSLDGKKLATAAKGGGGGLYVYDLEKKVEIINMTKDAEAAALIPNATSDELAAFMTFSPDGRQLAVVPNDRDPTETRQNLGIRLWNVDCSTPNCGSKAGNINLGGAFVTHPDWSPDGTKIVFAQTQTPNPFWVTTIEPTQSGLSYVERESAGWSSVKSWLPQQTDINRYAPNFSPDSGYAVFSESVCPPGQPTVNACNGNSDAAAKLGAIALGSNMPIKLSKANMPGPLDRVNGQPNDDLHNTFPKFSPFSSEYVSNGQTEPIYWVTFSSARMYGLRSPPPPPLPDRKSTWMWMAGFRPSEIVAGKDPSFPPFLIPYQDIETSNHQAVWAKELVGSTR